MNKILKRLVVYFAARFLIFTILTIPLAIHISEIYTDYGHTNLAHLLVAGNLALSIVFYELASMGWAIYRAKGK